MTLKLDKIESSDNNNTHHIYIAKKMKECKQVEKTANKDRQFFQQDEKVKVFHCARSLLRKNCNGVATSL